jgi:putative transposase
MMTETIEVVDSNESTDANKTLARRLLDQARAEGVDLVGPQGLLTGLTKQVLESALEEELSEHLGYAHGDRAAKPAPGEGNERNGVRTKTVLTQVGPVSIDVPRDREGTFEPQIVRKRQRRLEGVDHLVLSLTARGLTTGEIAAHFAEVYGASVSKDTISRITEKVAGEMAEWQQRPLDRIYPVIFIDALIVKVRDGQVRNKPFYIVIGVTTAGERDILGIWAGEGGEGAKFWLNVLTEIKNRGVDDVCIAVCDGLKGLPEAISTTWELVAVQTCVIHLIRNTFRYAARQHWDAMAKDLRPIYTAVNAEQAASRLEDFAATWGDVCPAAIRLWRNAWNEFIPFLDYDVEIRRIICTTNAIESLNARYRRAVRARGHFPNDAAALKCLYLVTRSLDPTGRGKARWVIRWKAALNAFAITFEGRISPSTN